MRQLFPPLQPSNTRFIFRNVNRSTDKDVTGTIADDIEAAIEAHTGTQLEGLRESIVRDHIKKDILPRMPDSSTPLPIDTFHAGPGGHLALRARPGSSGNIIRHFQEGKHEALFQGEIEPIPKDKSGQAKLNYHMWLKVKIRDVATGKILGDGWMSGEYLQGDLKDMVEPEPPVIEPPAPTPAATPAPTPAPTAAPAPPVDTRAGSHIVSATRTHGRIAPLPNQQFDQTIERDLGSDYLMESFKQGSIEALLKALEVIPVAQRPDILGAFFDKLGMADPAKAAAAMAQLNDVLARDRGPLEAQVAAGYDEKIAKAPNPDARSFWEAQKAFFEVSQGTLSPVQAQQKMREAYNQAKHLTLSNLTPEEQAMQAELITKLENYMRQALAMDMIQTVGNNIATGLEEQTELAKLVELAKTNPAEVERRLTNEGFWEMKDNDHEVAFAVNNINSALQYLIAYKYPEDIAAGVVIANPIRHYIQELTANGGVITSTPTWPTPIPSFINFARELELFNDYNSGDEDMGHGSIWNNFDGSRVALGNSYETEGGAFEAGIENINEIGHGIYGLSDEIFGSPNLFEHKGTLGAVDRLNIEKIRNAYANGHYDEARTLAIELIQNRLSAPTQTEINTRRNELLAKKGNKIRAQVRENLLNQDPPVDPSTNIAALHIPKSDGSGDHTDLDELISDKARVVLNDTAVIQLYGEKAANLSTAGLSEHETLAVNILNDINGTGIFDMAAENADWAASIAKTITEIIIIEIATAGTATFIAGAAGVARASHYANNGTRALRFSRGLNTQINGAAFGHTLGQRLLAGTRVGNSISRPVRYAAEGTSIGARSLRLGLHSTAFVEGQHLLHGNLVNPLSAEGAYEIGAIAMTFGVLGGTQRFMRGQSGLLGRTPLAGRYINSLSRSIGTNTQRLAQVNRLGYAGASSLEFGSEVLALHYLASFQETSAVYLHDLTGGAVGFTENQRQAMEETDAWRRWGHEAGVVLGLRTWRATNEALQRTGGEPIPLGRFLSRRTAEAKSPAERGATLVKEFKSLRSEHQLELRNVMGRRERLIREQANKTEAGQRLSNEKQTELVDLNTKVEFLEARIASIDASLAKADLGIGRVRLPSQAEVAELARSGTNLARQSLGLIKEGSVSIRDFIRSTAKNLSPTTKAEANNIVNRASRLLPIREKLGQVFSLVSKAGRERARLYKAEAKILENYTLGVKNLNEANRALKAEKVKAPSVRNSDKIERLTLAREVALTKARDARDAYHDAVQKSVNNDLGLVRKDIATFQAEISTLPANGARAVELQAKVNQLRKIETQLQAERSTRTGESTEPLTEPIVVEPAKAKAKPAPRTPEANRLLSRQLSLNNATPESPLTKTFETNTATTLKHQGRSTGVQVRVNENSSDPAAIGTYTLKLTNSYFNSARRNETTNLRRGETKEIELLNQTLVIRRTGSQIEIHLRPKQNYTVEGLETFTFEVGRTYRVPSAPGQPAARGTFARQEGGNLIFSNQGREVEITKTRIDELVIAGRVSLVD